MSGSTQVQIYTLGQFRVVVGGHVYGDDAWRRKRARQLLKCLLSRPHHRLLKATAIGWLWPDADDDESAASSLRSVVYGIRQVIDRDGSGRRLTSDGPSLALQPSSDLWIDADAFEDGLASARSAADAIPLLEYAVALYRGDFLPDDLFEEWSADRRDVLRRQWLQAKLELAHLYDLRGDPTAAAPHLHHILQAEHTNELAAQRLMRLYLQLNRPSDVIRVGQELTQALSSELGVEPGDDTRALLREATHHDAASVGSARAPFRCAYPFPEPSQLVGREQVLSRLQLALDRGRSSGQTLLISAPAGTGKSALVGSVVRFAQAAGTLCLAGGCYDERSGVPLAAFQEALTDYVLATSDSSDVGLSAAAESLRSVVSELRRHFGIAAGPRDDPSTERMRLFGAVLSFLRTAAERSPLLLCLEDLHAADSATLHLIHFLARQTRRSPVVLIGTLRSEELQPGEPLAQFVASLERERLVDHVHLDALSADATAQLLGGLLHRAVPRGIASALHARTEGNPLFIEQLVVTLDEQGLDSFGSPALAVRAEPNLPQSIRDLLDQRLSRLAPELRQNLEVAAVLGASFDYPTLLSVAAPDAELPLLEALDSALRLQLLRETAAGYAFSHSLLREAVYWGLTGPRRMLLHARVAATLERDTTARPGERAAELAYHLARAGQSIAVRRKLLEYSLLAGRQAAAVSSYPQALAHFGQACELIETEHIEADPAHTLTALLGRGRAQRELAMWPECIASFRRILDMSEGTVERAQARDVIAYALTQMGQIDAALAEVDAALAELVGGPPDEAVALAGLRLKLEKANAWSLTGQAAQAIALGEEMLREASLLNQPAARNWAHAALLMGYDIGGDVVRAVEHGELALAEAEQIGDKVYLAVSRESLGLASYRGGRLTEARSQLERALALYRDAANDARAINCLLSLGRVELAEGRLDRALEYGEIACGLAAEARSRFKAPCEELLGATYALRCLWDSAAKHFDRALELRERAAQAPGIVDSLVGLGLINAHRGAWQLAGDLLARAEQAASLMGPCPQLLTARRELGRFHLRQGHPAAARAMVDSAVESARAIPESIEVAPTRLALAEIHLAAGDLVGAGEAVELALAERPTASCAVEIFILEARRLLALGQAEAAATWVERATQAADRIGAPRLIGLARLLAARAAGADTTRSGELFDSALQTFEAAGTPYERALALDEYAAFLSNQSEQTARCAALREEARSVRAQLSGEAVEPADHGGWIPTKPIKI